MKKLVIFANCQSAALGQTLLENQEFASSFTWERVPAVQNVKVEDIPDLVQKVRSADLFVYQNVAPSSRRPEETATSFLKNQLKDNAIALSFPSLYFDGYFPHLKTMEGMVSTLNLVHDYFIAYGYAIGLQPDRLISIIQKKNFYPKNLSIRLKDKSIDSLKQREVANEVDIKASEFIEKNFKSTKLFNQFNHPKRAMFHHIGETILSRIALETPALNPVGSSHLDLISVPIYPSTYNNLDLDFEENFDAYSDADESTVDQATIVRRFYKFYGQYDSCKMKNKIMRLITTHKPFIPRVMETHL